MGVADVREMNIEVAIFCEVALFWENCPRLQG
jgi:hypothetical protein